MRDLKLGLMFCCSSHHQSTLPHHLLKNKRCVPRRPQITNLVDETRHEEPDLHEDEVGGGIEDGEVCEGQVVVEAVEGRRDEVVDADQPVPPEVAKQLHY